MRIRPFGVAHHRSLTIFFFNDTATTEIYTLSLHDALPIYFGVSKTCNNDNTVTWSLNFVLKQLDRKSTRLNSSHSQISYAVFCLKKKTEVVISLYLHSLSCFHVDHKLRGSNLR